MHLVCSELPLVHMLLPGDYIDPDVDPEVVVADLDGVLAHLQELRGACDTYKACKMPCDCLPAAACNTPIMLLACPAPQILLGATNECSFVAPSG